MTEPTMAASLVDEQVGGKRVYTVVGLTDECGHLTVAGVFHGEHNAVDSGYGADGAWRFATSLRAADPDEAEELAREEAQGEADDEDDDGGSPDE